MSSFRGNEKLSSPNVDELFQEFIREMDDQTTNGLVKKLDPAKIDPMVDHFVAQCERFTDKLELRDRIEALLLTKFDYALTEERVQISDRLEKNIREKIKAVLHKHINNVGRLAGFLINWAVFKPVKFFKTVAEPVVANTVLTYSLAVHPPYLDSPEVHNLNAIKPGPITNTQDYGSSNNLQRILKDLEIVKKYSEQDLVNLTQNLINNPVEDKIAVSSKKLTTLNTVAAGPVSQTNTGSQKVYVDVQRRIIDASPVITESSKIKVNRYSGELRPIGDVQRIIAQNDHLIYSCFNSYKKSLSKKSGRISMKFQISSKGMVKEIKVTYNSFSQELAERISLQLKTVRFNEIDGKLGDQTVYHTYYF